MGQKMNLRRKLHLTVKIGLRHETWQRHCLFPVHMNVKHSKYTFLLFIIRSYTFPLFLIQKYTFL
jgi:hypothetical protein